MIKIAQALMSFIATLALVLLLIIPVTAQSETKARLYAGPVTGSVTPHSARVWIAYKGIGNNVLMLADTLRKKVIYPARFEYIKSADGTLAMLLDFEKLEPSTWYNVFLSIEGWGTNVSYGFKTPSESAEEDFEFLTGSCALMLNGIGRIPFPGFSHYIFKRMKKKGGDFMLWLGDNTYYFGKDYESGENMFQRQLKQRRKYPILNDFLGSLPQYAIWDDHDFGPNNADSSFQLKEDALKVFQHFWPNTYPDQKVFKGNYFSFRYADCDFYMTDGRFWRSAPGDSSASMLGETQMTWLKKQLITSTATFKFIAVGSQVIDNSNFGEYYQQYPREYNELLSFITDNNVKGVIFLTGDKHFTELTRHVSERGYPFYDFTCSPLTSPPVPIRLFGLKSNPQRVNGFVYNFKNFGKLKIEGKKGARIAIIQVFDRRGGKHWEYRIHQEELQNRP